MRAFAFLVACMLAAAFPAPIHAALHDCGQPRSSGALPTASDALFVLQAATGAQTCEPCVCDVDSSGGASPVTASDALRVLRRAVGQAIELTCPGCSCETAQAPACGGSCAQGFRCAAMPQDHSTCGCRNECEVSDAPACGGSCAAALPAVLECHEVTFDSGQPIATCLCIPPNFTFCADSGGAACNGTCGPADVCVPSSGDTCTCEPQTPQGSCEQAAAPACGGTCGPELVCAPQDAACACLDAASHDETCAHASAPACGGACASESVCAVNGFGSCECFDPCEVSHAPACGGACLDSGKTCTEVVVSAGAGDLHLCQCQAP